MNSFQKRQARTKGQLITSSIKVRAREAIRIKTGQIISEQTLIQRTRWLAELTTSAAQAGLNAQWNETGMTALSSGFGSGVWEKANSILSHPQGAHLDSRVRRVAQAKAAETLRSASQQHRIVTALLSGSAPKATSVEIRSQRRSINKFIKIAGKAPVNFFELRPQPPQLLATSVRLDPADQRLSEWSKITSKEAILRLKLPLSERPISSDDYAWHELILNLPKPLRQAVNNGGQLAKPTLLLRENKLILAIPVDQIAPPKLTSDRVLSLDWGERRLLTGSIVWLADDGALRTSGRPLFFNSQRIQAKLSRLRANAEKLRQRIDRLEALHKNNPDLHLADKRSKLILERKQVWKRYNNLSRQLAHAASQWAVQQASANHCSRIIIEDLSSLEARSFSRTVNGRINSQVRGKLFQLIQHKAAKQGITIKVINPSQTSQTCPRCQQQIKGHQKASNNKNIGRSWLICHNCGHSADRDHAAAECIGSRSFTSQGEKDRALRRSHPPQTILKRRPRQRALAPILISRPGARRLVTGRCVRTGGLLSSTASAAEQLPFAVSKPGHRRQANSCQLSGMYAGFNGQLRFTVVRYRKPVSASVYKKA